jgi:hypothetical protein
LKGSIAWWAMEGFIVWWAMEGEGATPFLPLLTFPLTNFI